MRIRGKQIFSIALTFFLIASLVTVVFASKVLRGEDIYGDRDVWLDTETDTAYQNRTDQGGPYLYCENPNPCKDVRHFDCSGLIYFVIQYSLNIRKSEGRLKADEYFSKCYKTGNNIADASIGDLLFNSDKSHVGILTEFPNSTSFKVVQASGGRHEVVEDTRSIPNSFWTLWGDFVGNVGDTKREQIVSKAREQIGSHYLKGAEGDKPLWYEETGGTNATGVGGIIVPVDKFALLAPYIGLTSTIIVATVATAVYVKRVKRRKEKQ
jgi:hypothetical protein